MGRKQLVLETLPLPTRMRVDALSDEPSSSTAWPDTERTARGDEEERLLMASLDDEDRAFIEGHIGLGNSQKAEVAWLEEQGYEYEELDVREFAMTEKLAPAVRRVRSAASEEGDGEDIDVSAPVRKPSWAQ